MTVIYAVLLHMIPDVFRISAVRKRCISVALCLKADTMKLKEHLQNGFSSSAAAENEHRPIVDNTVFDLKGES